MSTISVTKCIEFEAAHCLPHYEGKCRHLHGHSYKLEVEVGMEENGYLLKEDGGMVIDFGQLKQHIEELIISKFDHHYLNDLNENNSLASFVFKNFPTAENLCIFIAEQLMCHAKLKVLRVRIWETSNSYAEWRA